MDVRIIFIIWMIRKVLISRVCEKESSKTQVTTSAHKQLVRESRQVIFFMHTCNVRGSTRSIVVVAATGESMTL